jgi:hypothetical protein
MNITFLNYYIVIFSFNETNIVIKNSILKHNLFSVINLAFETTASMSSLILNKLIIQKSFP